MYNFLSFLFLEVLILEGLDFTSWNSSRYDIRQNKIYYFKAVPKSIMAFQKHQKKIVNRNFFSCLNAYYPKAHLIKSLNSLDSSRKYGVKKKGDSRELFLPEKDFQNSSTKNFQKNIQIWRPGNQPKTWNSDVNFFAHALFCIWTQYKSIV